MIQKLDPDEHTEVAVEDHDVHDDEDGVSAAQDDNRSDGGLSQIGVGEVRRLPFASAALPEDLRRVTIEAEPNLL